LGRERRLSMNECIDYLSDPLKGDRKVVCAAIRSKKSGKVICGARHYDSVMRSQLEVYDAVAPINKAEIEQGFIDQWCNFLTREEAWVVANAAKQVIRVCGGNSLGKLFSENLY